MVSTLNNLAVLNDRAWDSVAPVSFDRSFWR
jgi:hypothetical protein